MCFQVGKFLLMAGFLLAGCVRHATSDINRDDPLPSLKPCSSTVAECDPGEVCDFLIPKASKPGTCLNVCKSTAECDPAKTNQVCNPITGTCEAPCNTNADCARSTQIPTARCSSARHCTIPAITSSCPSTLFKQSQGFCKLACATSADCSASSGQICNALTGTCELSCSVSVQTDCEALKGLNPPGAGTPNNPPLVSYDCSPVTNTCAISCKTGDSCGSGQTCYLPGAPASVVGASGGTCEFSCGGSRTCLTQPYTSCTENVCKKSCEKNSDCNSNQRCNLLKKVCDTPCATGSDCSSKFLNCSTITGVCTPACVTGASNTCTDFGANLVCYTAGIPPAGVVGTCELSCPGGSIACGAFTPYTKCVEGVCQKACVSNSECAALFQKCNPFVEVCQTSCNSGIDCHSSILGCSLITNTCVASCQAPSTTCQSALGSVYNCYSGGVTPAQGQTVTGTCEVTCTSSSNCQNFNSFQNCASNFCQKNCLVDTDCLGDQSCNIFSNSCQKKCTPGTVCGTGLACSPITATCVPSCTSPGPSCPSQLTCYVPGNPLLVPTPPAAGTCEFGCTASPPLPCQSYPPYGQCFDTVCQKTCASDTDCASNSNERCDQLSKICAIKCTQTNQCPLTFACSPLSGTCVPSCAADKSCPDYQRRACLIKTSSTCEIPCGPAAACPAGQKCVENLLKVGSGICGIGCSPEVPCPPDLVCSGSTNQTPGVCSGPL